MPRRAPRDTRIKSFENMKQRCSYPGDKRYKYYGGKGVKVFHRWLGRNGFRNFCEDMGPKPDASFVIDRIDNSQGYNPDNCRWVTGLFSRQHTSRNEQCAKLRREGLTR